MTILTSKGSGMGLTILTDKDSGMGLTIPTNEESRVDLTVLAGKPVAWRADFSSTVRPERVEGLSFSSSQEKGFDKLSPNGFLMAGIGRMPPFIKACGQAH